MSKSKIILFRILMATVLLGRSNLIGMPVVLTETSDITVTLDKSLYDANNETWPIVIQHNDYQKERFEITIDIAKKNAATLFKNWAKVQKTGILTEDARGRVSLTGFKLSNPINGFEFKHEFEDAKYQLTDTDQKEQELLTRVLKEAKIRHSELFLPKNEFESTAEYDQRLQQQKEFIEKVEQELIAEEKAKKKEGQRLEIERAAEEERLLQIKIAESLAPFEGNIISLGKYDADIESFNTLKFMVPIMSKIEKPKPFGFVLKWDAFRHSKRLYEYVHSKDSKMLNIYGTLEGATKLDENDIIAKLDYDKNFLVKGSSLGETKDIFKVAIQYLRLMKTIIDTIGQDNIVVKDIKIPRNEARDFKKNYSRALVQGYKQLTQDLKNIDNLIEYMEKDAHKYEYFNMVVIHPITGSRFPFGPTKDLAAAPVIAGKKSVVPPDLSMRVAFVEPNGNGFLDAEEKGKVKVSITNSGQGSAMGVFVKLNAETSNRDITAGTSKIIGEIPAGQTKTVEFEINASKSVTRMGNRFTVSATESYGFPPDPALISFETFPFIPPKLELVYFGVSTPNEGNEIRPQTTTEVQARVQNRGQGPAEDVQFSINLPKGVYFTPDSRQDYSFSALKPGEFKDLEFSFNTAKTVGKTIDVSIGFTEESTTGKFPLNLEVEKPQQTIQQLVVSGQEMGTMEFANVATVSVDIEKDIPTSGRKGKHDLAVVFGIESYKNIPGVSFARRDAIWMKKYFENILGIPKNRIYYKTDSDVGLGAFSKVFSEGGWLDKRLKEDKTNIFIYYAGHGAPDMKKNKAYLIPYDGDPNYASQTGYEMDALYEQLGNLGAASVTVFLDACFSGANRDNEMLLADARPIFMEVDASATRDVTVFSAAGGKEISSAWPEKKHGLFSYFLMKGMRGDADANNDKQITVGELGDYVKENVSDMAGMLDREQSPGLQTLDKEKVLISY